MEEGEDILDGLETMNVEDVGGDEKDKETKAEEWVQHSVFWFFYWQENFGALSMVN